MRVLILGVLMLSLGGCGIQANLHTDSRDCNCLDTYKSLKLDIETLSSIFSSNSPTYSQMPCLGPDKSDKFFHFHPALKGVITPFYIISFPIDFVYDTGILPITLQSDLDNECKFDDNQH